MNYQYLCLNCETMVEVPKNLMQVSCRCPVCEHAQVPAPSNHQITQQNVRTGLYKGYGIAVAITFIIGGLISGILPLLLGAAIALAIVVLPAWLIANVGTDLLYKHDQGYQDYRKNGGSPFWDNFLGENGQTTYRLPNPEPEYADFVPPRTWKYQCLNCKARVEGLHKCCWNCGIELN